MRKISAILTSALVFALVLSLFASAETNWPPATKKADWEFFDNPDGWITNNDNPMSITNKPDSFARIHCLNRITGEFFVSVLLEFQEGSTNSVVNALRLASDPEVKFALRTKYLADTQQFLVEAQVYSGAWTDLYMGDWIDTDTSNFRICLIHEKDADKMRLLVLNADDNATVLDIDLSNDQMTNANFYSNAQYGGGLEWEFVGEDIDDAFTASDFILSNTIPDIEISTPTSETQLTTVASTAAPTVSHSSVTAAPAPGNSDNLFDQWWLWVAIAGGIVIVGGAVFFVLKGKKKKGNER